MVIGEYLIGIGAATVVVSITPILMGFGSAGVASASTIATWQSSIGNVVAGTIFSGLQSAGATSAFGKVAAGGLSAAAVGFGLL